MIFEFLVKVAFSSYVIVKITSLFVLNAKVSPTLTASPFKYLKSYLMRLQFVLSLVTHIGEVIFNTSNLALILPVFFTLN